MEKHDIRVKRIHYLKELIKYRNEKRPIIYTDETYIHSSHTVEKGWYDDTLKGLKKPMSKGQRLIIVHAGGENGFIQDGLLIFKSGKHFVFELVYLVFLLRVTCFRYQKWRLSS